jgi:alkylated DNA nucleotide flippase Atl1
VIPVEGHVLDYRDTAEIAGIVRLMRDLGFVPWTEYRARKDATDILLTERPC